MMILGFLDPTNEYLLGMFSSTANLVATDAQDCSGDVI